MSLKKFVMEGISNSEPVLISRPFVHLWESRDMLNAWGFMLNPDNFLHIGILGKRTKRKFSGKDQYWCFTHDFDPSSQLYRQAVEDAKYEALVRAIMGNYWEINE